MSKIYCSDSGACDVCVIGAGLAGCMAAIEAASHGAAVSILSSASVCSGSSFYPGTWGLGLIAPLNDDDASNLYEQICRVGCGMVDNKLALSFVDGIRPAVAHLESLGVHLKKAEHKEEQAFIPCFDSSHRAWHGLLADSMHEVFAQKIHELGIIKAEQCEVLKIVQQDDGCICGIVAVHKGSLRYIPCKAVILASGGFGGLFQDHLCTSDVTGSGHALALECGCSLINMEFMQMMLGFDHPCYGTVCNEKTFRYISLHSSDGADILASLENQDTLLAERSTYGPFSSRLASSAVDLAVASAIARTGMPVELRYEAEMLENMPEFVRIYFDWLWEKKHLNPDSPVWIKPFAHAANGGIKIDADAWTGIPGLYACGEVTGGMHGADRIGGLSTANALVFGLRAGMNAARHAAHTEINHTLCQFEAVCDKTALQKSAALRKIMTEYCMIDRTEEGLIQAHKMIEKLSILQLSSSDDMCDVAGTYRLRAQLKTAAAIVQAQRNRRESRGSHFRSDYPQQVCGQEV